MSKSLSLVILALALTACESNATDVGTVQETGGNSSVGTTAVAGIAGQDTSKSTGGSSSASTSSKPGSTGGSSTVVSTTTSTTGGSSTVNSTATTGGSSTVSSTTTLSNTGGSSAKATGGYSSTGGSSAHATGGSNPGTDGSSARVIGGSNTGTGGSSSQPTGGSLANATGGSNPGTGGSSAQATGGGLSTGGSSTQATGGSNPGIGGSSSYGKPQALTVAVGLNQTCAVLVDGRVQCWGQNDKGQLGDGTTTARTSPVFVSGISTAIQVSTFEKHSCALLSNGTIRCWGLNQYGQLGNGLPTINSTNPLAGVTLPVQFAGTTSAIQVTVGLAHTCILQSDHTVWCLGYQYNGLLGTGKPNDPSNYYSVSLVQVSGITNAIFIQSNTSYTCALLSDKTIKCWGQAMNHEFVDGFGSTTALAPVVIPSITNATQLSVGLSGICYIEAIIPNSPGAAYCWGSNSSGQIGWSPTANPYSSIPASLSSYQYIQVSLGTDFTCAVREEGSVHCFGGNESGQLGGGNTTNNYNGTLVSNILSAQSVFAGGSATCAILSTGSLQCWGVNTGNSTNPTSSTPVTVDGF